MWTGITYGESPPHIEFKSLGNTIAVAVFSKMMGRQHKFGAILLWYKFLFNHWFFTASSFGIKKKIYSRSVEHSIFSSWYYPQESAKVFEGEGFKFSQVSQVCGQYANFHFDINLKWRGIHLKMTRLNDSESTLFLRDNNFKYGALSDLKLCRAFSFT